MMVKFVIFEFTRSAWYDGQDQLTHPDYSANVKREDCFVMEEIELAWQFDTYQEAENMAGVLPRGIYNITKIFIRE
jgi:hypothetical protein